MFHCDKIIFNADQFFVQEISSFLIKNEGLRANFSLLCIKTAKIVVLSILKGVKPKYYFRIKIFYILISQKVEHPQSCERITFKKVEHPQSCERITFVKVEYPQSCERITFVKVEYPQSCKRIAFVKVEHSQKNICINFCEFNKEYYSE